MKAKDQITYSEKGVMNLNPRNINRKGVIISECKDGECVRVVWEGNTSSSVIHKTFIETAENKSL